MSEQDDRLLRDKEVARYYDVSERTVRHWRASGLLPTVRTPAGKPRTPATVIRDSQTTTRHALE